MFMFRPDVMIEEMRKCCPEILAAAEKAVAAGATTGASLTLDAAAFEQAESDSIDYAVMEKTKNAAIAPIAIDWSDVGSWSAVAEISEGDAQGNGGKTDAAVLVDCKNCLVLSEDVKITAIGLEGFVIVESGGAILIAPKGRAQEVKQVTTVLKERNETDLL